MDNINLDDLLTLNSDDSFCLLNYKVGLAKREIYIDSDITEQFAEMVIFPFKWMEQDNPTAPIHIFINCQGGNITDAMVLCDLIDNTTCPVTVEIMGYAYSMACYLAMAGFSNPNVKTVCHKHSFGLIHAGSVGYSGDARKAKQIQEFYDKIDALLKDYILSHTKITEEQYTAKEDVEWYLTSADMLELGIVDEII